MSFGSVARKLSLIFLIIAIAFNLFDAIFAASGLSLLILGGGGIAAIVLVINTMLVAVIVVMLPAIFALYFHRHGKYALCISVSISIVAISASLITVEGANAIATTLQFPLLLFL